MHQTTKRSWSALRTLRSLVSAALSALGSWRLFWLLAFTLSAANYLKLLQLDIHSARGLEAFIIFSVRCALPLFIVAFTASSLKVLWPCRATRWLLANRRYFGLGFAAGMAWHLSFVAYSFYLFGNRLNAIVLAADAVGAAFLLLLTVTSFRFVSRHMKLRNWRRLHRLGVYAIWLLALYIYQGIARADRDALHILFLAILIGAWLLRVAAWAKTRSMSP
jgi:hypothetical protein